MMENITIKEIAEALANGQNVSLIFPRHMGRSWVLAECKKYFETEEKETERDEDKK